MSVLCDATVTWLGMLVYMYCLCWCDLDPIHGQGHGAFELPTIAHNCTFPCLSPSPLSRSAHNSWLLVIVWDLDYSLSEPDFWISFYESYHESWNFAEYPHFTTFKQPYFRTAWCYSHMVGLLVVLQLLCMLMWPWPDPRSRSRAFELPTISEAVHACWRRWPWALFRGFLVVFLYMGCALAPPGKYDWTICVQRWCSLMSNYFDHLLLNESGVCYWIMMSIIIMLSHVTGSANVHPWYIYLM